MEIQDKPYVIFKSSRESNGYGDSKYYSYKYWAIVDDGVKNVKDILENTEWIVHNKETYVRKSQRENTILIRGTYRNLNKKPKIEYHSDNLSKDFKEFIKLIRIL